MAEGFLKYYAKEMDISVEVVSAGVQTDGLNPRAVVVMSEVGIDISEQTSDLVDQFLDHPTASGRLHDDLGRPC